MKRVFIESPLKGKNWEDMEENLHFARLCKNDCLRRNEAPFASHVSYVHKDVLDDKIKSERTAGINAGSEWRKVADLTVVYINRGISTGMLIGIKESIVLGQKVEFRWLPNYENNTFQAPPIISVTGETGSGKTTTFGGLLNFRPTRFRPVIRMITSLTSRDPRTTDLLGEYQYGMTAEKFKQREKEFLWVKEYGGHFYGTMKVSIRDALDPSSDVENSLMILVPDAVRDLRVYLSKFGVVDSLLSFYILSPGEDELRKRLSARGDKEEVIQARLKNYGKWDKEALASDIPYIFLRNDGPFKEAAQQMLVFF